MRDYKIIEVERKDNEIAEYNDWIDNNTDVIIEEYTNSIDIDDVPDSFIQNMYEEYMSLGRTE